MWARYVLVLGARGRGESFRLGCVVSLYCTDIAGETESRRHGLSFRSTVRGGERKLTKLRMKADADRRHSYARQRVLYYEFIAVYITSWILSANSDFILILTEEIVSNGSKTTQNVRIGCFHCNQHPFLFFHLVYEKHVC